MDMKIDKDIVNSLYGFYFKNIEDKISAASNRAYRDFCRTFKIDKEFKNIKNELKEKVTKKFKEKIKFIIKQDNIDRKTFDDWHCDVCDNIIKIYMEKNINLTYGQAQKWLNMTIKYLYCLQYSKFKKAFHYLHVPIDNRIIKSAYKDFEITKPSKSWSK